MEQLALNFDLTREEQVIVNCLWPGRMRAVSASRISASTGINERRIRQVVRHLIDHHRLCIGSATDDPAGFFMLTDPGELADAIGALRHRGIMILVRAAKLSGNSIEEIFRQGRLELEVCGE